MARATFGRDSLPQPLRREGSIESFLINQNFSGRLSLLRSDVKHVLTHRILLADFYLLECDEKPTLPADFIWIPEADIDNYAVPRLVELLLEEVAKRDKST